MGKRLIFASGVPGTGPVYKSAPQMFINMRYGKILKVFKYGKGPIRFHFSKDHSGVILEYHLLQQKFGIIEGHIFGSYRVIIKEKDGL